MSTNELALLQAELQNGHYYQRWARAFGEERLEHDRQYPATPEAIEELVQGIAHVCTGEGGRSSVGTHRYIVDESSDHGPVIIWNDAQIAKGFSPDILELAPAAIARMSYAEQFAFLPSRGRPIGKYAVREDLYIDPHSNVPLIRRTLIPLPLYRRINGNWISATKPANALEVAAATQIVRRASGEKGERTRPVYLEVAYGLDPAAVTGNRRYDNKSYVGVDAALGHYAIEGDESYSDAVLSQTAVLQDRVNSERPGEHIVFNITHGEQLPFDAASVREVFASNFLNAPDIELDDKKAVLAEAKRVLEKTGRLVIRVNWHTDVWPPDKTMQLLREQGFVVLEVVEPDRPSYDRLDTEYGKPQNVKAPEGYYIIAEAQEAFGPAFHELKAIKP